MSDSVRESLTGYWLADRVIMVLFGLVFGWTFVRGAIPRFGPVDYRMLGWACASGLFWYLIGYNVAAWLGWI